MSTKIANNEKFNEEWVKLQRYMGDLLTLCHTEVANIPINQEEMVYSNIEDSLQRINYLGAVEKA